MARDGRRDVLKGINYEGTKHSPAHIHTFLAPDCEDCTRKEDVVGLNSTACSIDLLLLIFSSTS